jgi:hypothetical protein
MTKTTEVLYNKVKLMHSNDDGQTDQFDASLELPIGNSGDAPKQSTDQQAAADLIRKKSPSGLR